MSPGLAISGLTSRFGTQTIFENLNFGLAAGKCTALLGPSGAGKTTLLRIIAGLEPAASGTVTATDSHPLTHRIAYMAQQDLLLPWATALNNVMLGARLRGEKPDPDRAQKILTRAGLAHRAAALPAELSGGMRSRVALARTLYEQRPVVLLDEPFAALDAITRLHMQNLAAELLTGRTVLFITHDPLEACRLGHAVLVLSGNPARLGPPVTLPGAPPRAPDDPALLATQGQLLRQLAG